MIRSLKSAWDWLPVVVRAPIIAFIVLQVSQVTYAGVLGNLKLHPQVPWALPATLILLAAFWYYFTGGGFPASTRTSRRHVTRQNGLHKSVARAVVAPVLFSMLALGALRLLLPSVLPLDPPTIAIDLSGYSLGVIVGILVSIAIVSGVTEEVVFRGYLQKPLEDAYGVIPAILVTGVAFWLAHSDKVTLTHLPFHMATSLFFGLLAYLTKSLWPAIWAHVAGDAVLLPAYYFQQPSFVWVSLTARPVWEGGDATSFGARAEQVWEAISPGRLMSGPQQTVAILAWAFAVFAGLTLVALVRLAIVARSERTSST